MWIILDAIVGKKDDGSPNVVQQIAVNSDHMIDVRQCGRYTGVDMAGEFLWHVSQSVPEILALLTAPPQSDQIAALKLRIRQLESQLCATHRAADKGPGGCIACTLESRAEKAERALADHAQFHADEQWEKRERRE